MVGYGLLFAARPIAQSHGIWRERELVCILLAGLLGILHWAWSPRAKTAESRGGMTEWLPLLLPVFGLLQVVPLPLGVLRIVSPARARLVDALGTMDIKPAWAPLSVTPSATVFHCLMLAGCLVVFWVVYDLSGRLRASPWMVMAPLVIMAGGEAILGLLQVSETRAPDAIAVGTFLIRNHYSGFLELVLPFAALFPISILTKPRARGESTPMGGVLLACAGLAWAALILVGILSSLSRMGVLATLASAVLVTVLALGRGRSWRQSGPVFAAVLAVMVLAVFVLPSERLVGRFADLDRRGRTAPWAETGNLIKAYPLLGCGLGGYESAFVQFKSSHALFDQDYAHNDYLQYFSELGLVGFVIGAVPLVLIVFRLRNGWVQQARPDAAWLSIACAGSIGAIAAHSLADFNLYVPANMLVLAWIMGAASCNGVLGLQRIQHDRKEAIPAASGIPGRSRHRP